MHVFYKDIIIQLIVTVKEVWPKGEGLLCMEECSLCQLEAWSLYLSVTNDRGGAVGHFSLKEGAWPLCLLITVEEVWLL